MRYIQHQLLALASILDQTPPHFIITLSPSFRWMAITPTDIYEHASYVYLLEKIQEGINKTMIEKGITKEQLYAKMKETEVPKEEVKLY